MNTEIEKTTQAETEQKAQERPTKADYIEKIKGLSAEDQAFMDGYLFAKVTSRAATA